MNSANYRISNHYLTGGGGSSSQAGLAVTGTITTLGSSMMAADDWAIYNGLVGSSLGQGGRLLAFYTTMVEDTVTFESKLLKASYGGGSGEVSGSLSYRAGGNSRYTSLGLTLIDGDSLSVNIPAELLDVRGLEFYFKITRGSDIIYLARPDSPYVWVTRFTNEQGQVPSATRAGSYRMISLPINIDGSNLVEDLFEDDLGPANANVWRLGSYDSNLDSVIEYPAAAPAVPTQGYWLITKEATTYGAAGTSVRPSVKLNSLWYYPVPVNRGWNQIANPFPFEINWQDVLFEYNGTIRGHDSTTNVFWYAGAGYSTPRIMQAWKGFFFFTWERNLKLFFPYQKFGLENAPPAKPGLLTEDFDWTVQLQLSEQGRSSERCLLSTHQAGRAGYDPLDRPMPPAPPGYPSLGTSMPGDNRFRWAHNVQEPIDSVAQWPLIFGPGRDRQLTISGLSELPEFLEMILILDFGAAARINRDTTINLPDDSRQAKLIIGRSKLIDQLVEETLPEDYQLSQNFPNPFNPETTIRFALPQTDFVKLQVYNLLGQEVVTLVNRTLPTGIHTIKWNGRASNGHRVSSGIYFYRLSTASISVSKKMLLLK